MSLKKEFTSGVFYTSLAKYSGIVISLVITSVLSRLLTPEDFGVVAIATVIISFFNILGDIGIGPAIIQNRNLSKYDLNHIYSLTIFVGVILAVAFWGLSFAISSFYDDPTLKPVSQWLCLSIFFTCINIVPLNLQYKSKNFKRIAIVTLIVQVISGIAAIIYAFSGGGVYALVLQSLASTGILALIYNYIARLHFSFHIEKSAIEKIFSFSMYQMLFNIINYFSRNLDKLLVGKYIGLSPLGYYEKSYRMMMLPLQNITFVITPVMLPVFSGIQDNRQLLVEKYNKVLSILSYISFPLSVVLFFCGKELILIIFGSQWMPAVLPFKILAFSVATQILTSTAGSIYQAVSATKQLFISGCWGAFFIIAGFAISIGFFSTLEAVCIGFLLSQLANAVQTFWLLYKTLDAKVSILFKIILRPVITGCICFVFLQLTAFLIPDNTNLIISFMIKCMVGGLTWLAAISLLSPYSPRNFILSRLRKSNHN